MKKKQLFAVLLAGSMTVGMAPAAAFAAEDTGAGSVAAEALVTDDNTDAEDTADNTDDTAAAEAEAQAAAEAQAEAETQAAAEAEAQKQAEAQAQAEAEAQAAAEAEAQKQTEEQAAAEAAAKEAAEKGTIVTTEAELHAAIEAATAVDTSTTAVTEAEPTKIVISGTIELTGSVTIPANKSIAILGADTQASIERADSFKGNLFEVSAGSALYMAKKDATETDTTVGTLNVDGSVTDGSAAEGSLVHVAAGANFSLTTGVTLANNNTTAKGAAIFNEGGSVLITGGTITGNKCDNGAVYSTGTISVKKGEGATDSEPSITGNTKADGTTPANIILSGEGKIEVKGEITDQAKIGFSVESPAPDLTVITKADDLTDTDVFAAALKNLASQYEGDTTKFTVDAATGKLAAVEVTKPVVSIESSEWKSGTTATAVITSDKDGQLYYKWVAEGAEAPTFDTSKDGEAVKAGEKHSIKLEKLTGKKVILYVQVKDSEGNLSEVKNTPVILSETPKQAPKITKAAFSKWNSISEAEVTITSDKAGHYYYKSVKHGTKVTSIDTSGKGTEISANKATSITLSKLDTKTSYDVYVCVKDSDGLVSDLKKIELNQSKRPTPKPTQAVSIDVKWTGFQWTAHDSASVTLRTNVTGTCYYTWAERGSDGTSDTPKKDEITNKQAVSKDKNFTIYLSDLNTDNGIDLYFYIKSSKGAESGIKKVRFDQSKRPAKGDDNHDPVTPKVNESILKGLNSAMEFYPNTFYDFQVIGAGTTNTNPGEGDVKWEPLYWSTSANPKDDQKHSTWKIGSTKGISKQGTYNLYVFFQKWVYTGGQWTETDTVESAVYQFSSVAITITPSGTGTPGSSSGNADGQTGSDPDATVAGAASATSSNGGDGTTSKNAVSTADNSPIGTMSALAVASILAGGYVIVRRRKKDI